MEKNVPRPSIERLCAIYGLLEGIDRNERRRVSSRELGERIGETAHTVRKDIGHLTAGTISSAGYDPRELKETIAASLGLDQKHSACIVGLGRLGQAILDYAGFSDKGIEICAGFDSNVNKLELLSSNIPLLPSHRISSYVAEHGITLGILAVPPENAQPAADRLIEGGIRGIVNFSTPVIVPPTVRVRQISVLDELRILSALIQTSG